MENQLLDNDMLDNNESKSLNEILTNGYETHAVEYIKRVSKYSNRILVILLGILLLLVLFILLSAQYHLSEASDMH